jgi:hypothetical protein
MLILATEEEIARVLRPMCMFGFGTSDVVVEGKGRLKFQVGIALEPESSEESKPSPSLGEEVLHPVVPLVYQAYQEVPITRQTLPVWEQTYAELCLDKQGNHKEENVWGHDLYGHRILKRKGKAEEDCSQLAEADTYVCTPVQMGILPTRLTIQQILRVFWVAALCGDAANVLVRTVDGVIQILVLCSDDFYVGSADAEELSTEEHVQILEQTYAELKGQDHMKFHVGMIAIARIRGISMGWRRLLDFPEIHPYSQQAPGWLEREWRQMHPPSPPEPITVWFGESEEIS